MKRVAICFVAATVLAICSVAANAQTISGALLKANIPFDFSVQNVVLEKGTYVIDSIGERSQCLRSAASSKSVLFLSTPMSKPNADPSKYVLIFHRYGNEHVLAEVWSGENGHLLPKSRREAQLAKASQQEPVTVALLLEK